MQKTAELRDTTELLQKIFATTEFCIVYLDPRFNFIQVNQAYADVCGRPADFFVGKNHFELFPNDENQAIFESVVRSGTPFSVYAKPFVFPDDPQRVTYWDWSLLPVKNAQGVIDGLLFCLVDVTKRRKAEEELARTQKELAEAKRLSDIGTLAAAVAHEPRQPARRDPHGGL